MLWNFHLEPVTVITGHYGCGKTNLALNLALDCLRSGGECTVVDLDIVNPYFRSSDYAKLIEERGGSVVAPVLAGTSVDVPSLSAKVGAAIEWAQGGSGRHAIIDVGGDDAGATALARFNPVLQQAPYDMVYVVNRYRNQTHDPADCIQVLREIETACRLHATALAGNSHLRGETLPATIEESFPHLNECSARSGLPVRFATVPKSLVEQENAPFRHESAPWDIYPVNQYVKTPWE